MARAATIEGEELAHVRPHIYSTAFGFLRIFFCLIAAVTSIFSPFSYDWYPLNKARAPWENILFWDLLYFSHEMW